MEAALRYVVLRHEGIEEPHFDLMIEAEPGGVLNTWRCDRWPLNGLIPFKRLPPHRRKYLEFEGTLSDNRGFVRKVESGLCSVTIEGECVWTVSFSSTTKPVKLVQVNSEIWQGGPV